MAGLLAVKTDRRHLPETWAAFGHVTCDTMLSSEKFTFENHAIRLNNKKKSHLVLSLELHAGSPS